MAESGHIERAGAAGLALMHDIRLIRDNPDAFDEGLRRRGLAPLSAELIALDERRRAAIAALQEAQERRNALSREVGDRKSTRLNSSHANISYAVFCLKKKQKPLPTRHRQECTPAPAPAPSCRRHRSPGCSACLRSSTPR